MDDSKLSLYIDGRLPEEAAREIEARLHKEAPLRRRVEEFFSVRRRFVKQATDRRGQSPEDATAGVLHGLLA
ncbi:MAG: hypothetical protein O7E54_04150, partial [Planctomycetota bacterium]|nr:hypothetical protein [Planctomycetota bacterium]